MSKTETKVGWTPGPWTVGKSSDNDILCVDARPNDHRDLVEVCEVWGTESDDRAVTPEAKANARLISKAPEMAERLAELIAICQKRLPNGLFDREKPQLEAAERLLAEIGGAGFTVTNSK